MSENNKYSELLNEWNSYSSCQKSITEDIKEEIDTCFSYFIDRITNNEITLEDYATKADKDHCPYLCTFIERKSKEPYGYARVGNMYQYGISYIAIKNKYFISDSLATKEQKKSAEKYTAEKKKQEISIYEEKIAKEVFDAKIKPFLKLLINLPIDKKINKIGCLIEGKLNPIESKQFFRKIIAMKNIGQFLFIFNDTIDTLYEFFIGKADDNLRNIEKNYLIVVKLKELEFKSKKDEKDSNYMIRLSCFIWEKFNSTLNFEAKNTILHGAPGTGKTYMTEKSILNNLSILHNQDINKQYKLVQFHPSFGYEEFIDGIKPVISKNSTNGIQLELVNGIFKEMCIDAFKELILARNEKREAKKFYFVADEINRAELSRVFGELLLCLEEDKRLILTEEGNLIGTKIKTQNSSLWQKEHAVVILDDKERIIELEDNNYKSDGEKFFGVPVNLYFIGTMNDIDRSVDSFDMALRRRFVWKHYSYKKEVVEEHYGTKNDLVDFLDKCQSLNDYIIEEEGFNLPESYMLGQSYFMGLSSFSDTQLQKRWDERISPLLTEYLRVNFEGKELIKQLKEAKEKFIQKKKL